MSNVIPFKKPSLKKKAKEKTLCSHGFHKWKVVTKNQFDSKAGKLVTTYRCERCGKKKNEAL
ncbi:MAG: hypothetical protein COC05_00120 [Gammaproteobacteria bacterium]|nr:hypothetical protein [Beggiatoa alba]PCH61592.1 MAG: hypothetical protein COC05_00120 [Gammaproteobacteria bacterium]